MSPRFYRRSRFDAAPRIAKRRNWQFSGASC